jgi:competence protein ComEC
VVTEGQHAYALWAASEPVRVVVEYGEGPEELYRHSYSGSREYAEAGIVKLVAAQGEHEYVYRVRMTDRAGNEAAHALEGETGTFATGILAPEDLLLFAMIDVGWGDALYLEAPDGTNCLIDAGHPQDAPAVRRFLEGHGVTELDFASMTHVHEDHIGGFYGDSFNDINGLIKIYSGAERRFPIGTFLDLREKTVLNGPYENLDAALLEHSGLGKRVFLDWGISSETSEALRWGEGVRVDLLAAGRKPFLIPEHIIVEETNSVINNDSMVFRVQYGDFVLLLMGDGEFATEQFLENHYPAEMLRAHILKLGHHGSNDSNSERFLRMVDPIVGLIPNSVTENPGVEHPYVLQRLRNRNVDYYASDRVIPNRDRALPGVRGNVLVWTDGEGFTVVVEDVRYE